jgi:hypothetical protein
MTMTMLRLIGVVGLLATATLVVLTFLAGIAVVGRVRRRGSRVAPPAESPPARPAGKESAEPLARRAA